MELRNINVYNINEAIKASKYPMLDDVSKATSEITATQRRLGSQPRGSAHDNFLNGILVSFDLTCSNKMWIEFERYHFADIVSGQSTMHRIVKLAERNIFNEYVVDETKETLKKLLDKFNKDKSTYNYLCLLYNIPSGIELTDHIVTNYGQLKTMYNQRHNHRLPEWRKFCDYVIQLPFFSELTGITKEKTDEQTKETKGC